MTEAEGRLGTGYVIADDSKPRHNVILILIDGHLDMISCPRALSAWSTSRCRNAPS
jgi:hypothetical protein